MRFALLLALACLAFSTAISAQQLATNGGAINGQVTDTSGSAIPGVKVTITSPAFGSVTSDNGPRVMDISGRLTW